MILRFGAELGYQGPPDAFILSRNLSSALEDPAIIDKKLTEDLALGRVVEVDAPTPPFICSPLGLVPKHEGGWRRIHHLSYPRGSSVNDYIPDGAGELRYTRFQEVHKIGYPSGKELHYPERGMLSLPLGMSQCSTSMATWLYMVEEIL